MKNRLSRIVTRAGDHGTTGLGDGARVAKNSPRIEAIGEVDELNSFIGLLRCEPLANDIQPILEEVQHRLFDVGGELCMPGHALIHPEHVAWLETSIAAYNGRLPPLREFILPGGTRSAALAHVARAVCRRAERAVVSLDQQATEQSEENLTARQFLNRLSDLLFVLARVLNQADDRPEPQWRREQPTGRAV